VLAIDIFYGNQSVEFVSTYLRMASGLFICKFIMRLYIALFQEALNVAFKSALYCSFH